MRIQIPPIIREIPLGDYAPELAGQALQVWVNPPARVLDEYERLRERFAALKVDESGAAELAGLLAEAAAWFAAIWSAGPDAARHWTAEDVAALDANETDPALGAWLRARTWEAIRDHRRGQKKT